MLERLLSAHGEKAGVSILTLVTALALWGPISPAAAEAGASKCGRTASSVTGDAVTWGSNSNGQLGGAVQAQRTAPRAVSGPSELVAAGTSCNGLTALVLTGGGSLWSWGGNISGELGDGTLAPRSTPAPIPGISGVVSISHNSRFCLASTSDGSVWGWGENGSGQLCDSGLRFSKTPLKLGGIGDVSAVSAGAAFCLALKRDGTVWAWGANAYGQLGDGSAGGARGTPTQVQGLSGVVAIAAGYYHALAVTGEGTVWAWGRNHRGQLGDGTREDRHSPVQVAELTGVTSSCAGAAHSLALKADGTLWAWGSNGSGQLGNGTNTSSNSPLQVSAPPDIKYVAAGYSHNLAATASGALYAWGSDNNGECAAGVFTSHNTPVPVAGPSGVKAIAAGFFWSMAIDSSGSAWTWGSNIIGQLGDGRLVARSSPEQVSGLGPARAVAAGEYHTLAIMPDGTVWAWGDNEAGQSGGDPSFSIPPHQVQGLLDITALSASDYFNLALSSDGTVWAWGENTYGQLGDGTYDWRPDPVQVQDLSDVIAIETGCYFSVALKSDGSVWAWGRNLYGELGDGTTQGHPLPAPVLGIDSAVSIGAEIYSSHALAVLADGRVMAWGLNANGQLGDGTKENRTTPVQVQGIGDVIMARPGAWGFSIALKKDGTVWGWGANGRGHLGDGSTADSLAPVQSAGLSGVTSIDVGDSHTLALKNDGTVWAWGTNFLGAAGQGDYSDQIVPAKVPGLFGVTQVSAGGDHSSAISACGLTCDAAVPQKAEVGIPVTFSAMVTVDPSCTGTPSYRWDFGDGFASDLAAPSHAYAAAKVYGWKLTVSLGGIECSQSGEIEVGQCGRPACASAPLPEDGAQGVASPVTLSWWAVPGVTGYDVYLWSAPPIPLIASTLQPTLALGGLSAGLTYHWTVVPRNACGGATGCPAWSFTVSGTCTDMHGYDDCAAEPATAQCCCFVPDHVHDLGQLFPAQSFLRIRYRAGTPNGSCEESQAIFYAASGGADFVQIDEDRVPARSGADDTEHTVDLHPPFPFRMVKVSVPVCYNDWSSAEAWCGATPPEITSQPQDISVISGDGATLSVQAVGAPPLAYQWYQGERGDTVLPVGGNSERLTTQPLFATTRFWVRVSNGQGYTDSRSALVTVEQPCTVTCSASASPASGIVPLAVSFDSSVSATGCEWPVEVIWDFGDGHSDRGTSVTYTYAVPGTYTWTMTASSGNTLCQKSGSVEVTSPVAWITGRAGINAGDRFYLLNGQGVIAGIARAKNIGTGEVYWTHMTSGRFAFPDLPLGPYEVWLDLTYRDHVLYGSEVGGYGCASPTNGFIDKAVSSAHLTVELSEVGTRPVEIGFAPPLIMLHGVLSCFRKWYDAQPPERWDNAARAAGYISFTPGWSWGAEVAWEQASGQVLEQTARDLAGLSVASSSAAGTNLPMPYAVVAHDAGGLLARAIAAGSRGSEPLVQSARAIYLMGTPNSGSDWIMGGGEHSPVSVNSVVRRFNEVYPDFGSKGGNVYALAGNSGLWGLPYDDGRVSIFSAFNITRMRCGVSENGTYYCWPYVSLALDSTSGHIFPYNHGQLGGPPSKEDILEGIMLDALGPPGVTGGNTGGPDSPAGGIVWGTNSRTVGTASGVVKSAESSMEHPFTVGDSIGMAVMGLVTQGSAAFEVLDPAGRSIKGKPADADDPGFRLEQISPAPGTWRLRVTPGQDGAAYRAVFLEDSPFGINGYSERDTYAGGEEAWLRMDAEGHLSDVQFTGVTATLYGLDGSEAQVVQLFDDGDHHDGPAGDGSFGGALGAPGVAGSYLIKFRATGQFGGKGFVRESDWRVAVLGAHWFTGAFLDSAADGDSDGKNDAIRLECETSFPRAGGFVLSASLYDSKGALISSSTAPCQISSPGLSRPVLTFDMRGAKFSQFSEAFVIRGLTISSGVTLEPLDAWSDILTGAYDPAGFSYAPGAVMPSPSAVVPDEGVRGQSLTLNVAGAGFFQGASFSLGQGVSVLSAGILSQELATLSISIAADAEKGPRALTVTNADGSEGMLASAFEVKENGAPQVNIQSPAPGETVAGMVPVAVAASDDVGLTQVVLKVDGLQAGLATRYPYRFYWDSTSVRDGKHALQAVATDQLGAESASTPVEVTVKNITVPGDCDGSGAVSIGEVQKAITMFLGTSQPGCGADCNGDGQVSIGEVQKVINAFLGLPSAC